MKLSIITINYNNREGLRKTIDSVISQTWQDFEWIIVDGGSTDGSRELIEQTAAQLDVQGWTTEQFSGPEDPASFMAEHQLSSQQDTSHSSLLTPHSLKWCSEKDKGIYNAMNKGIVHAEGEYCLFLNSGDRLFEKDTLVAISASSSSADIVYGDWKTDQSSIIKKYFDTVSISSLYKRNICHQAMFIRTSVLKKEGFDESFKILADWARWMKLVCTENAIFEHVPIIVCVTECGGVSTNRDQDHDDELDRLRNIPPQPLRGVLQECYSASILLSKYNDNFVLRDALGLVTERPFFFRAYRLFNSCMKILLNIFKLFHL